MPQVPRYLSPTNGFIPEATGQAIAYVRDPNRFKLNQYVQLIKAEVPIVAYAVLDPDQPARVPNPDYFRWSPGSYRPKGWNNTGNFIWQQVECERFNYGYTVDYQAIDSARGWNPKAFFNAIILQQAMTLMTQRFVTLMTTSSNWVQNGYNAYGDANTLNGGAGSWAQASDDPASPHFMAIRKTLLQVAQNINLATNGAIKTSDLILIVSPGLATKMGESAEIISYLARQERSLAVLKGEDPSVTTEWGLPNPFCGFKVVVEDAVVVSELPNSSSTAATTNRNWIMPDSEAVVVSRIGGIDGNYGSPSASTLQRYFYKYDMAVEAFDRPRHKLFESNVVDQFKEVLAAPRAGYLIQNVI